MVGQAMQGLSVAGQSDALSSVFGLRIQQHMQ